MADFRDVVTRILVKVYQSFGGACCLHPRPDDRGSKHLRTSVRFYQNTRCNIPGDSHHETYVCMYACMCVYVCIYVNIDAYVCICMCV
jgi:hypothetical protein